MAQMTLFSVSASVVGEIRLSFCCKAIMHSSLKGRTTVIQYNVHIHVSNCVASLMQRDFSWLQ